MRLRIFLSTITVAVILLSIGACSALPTSREITGASIPTQPPASPPASTPKYSDSKGNIQWTTTSDRVRAAESVDLTNDVGYIAGGDNCVLKIDGKGKQSWIKVFDCSLDFQTVRQIVNVSDEKSTPSPTPKPEGTTQSNKSGNASLSLSDSGPHLEMAWYLDQMYVSNYEEDITATLIIKGVGGKVEDLPPEVRKTLPRKPLDVVLVIDRSGSMKAPDYSPSRMAAVKSAAKLFIDKLQDNDRVSIVSFAEDATVDASLTCDVRHAQMTIDKMDAQGNTAIGEGILMALTVLDDAREEAVKSIVLLSDGANNRGTEPQTVAISAKRRGIPIFTIGIGTVEGVVSPEDPTKYIWKLDEKTLREIAVTTGGEYLYAPDEKTLERIYQILTSKVLNVAGLNVDVSIIPSHFFDLTEGNISQDFDVITVGAEKQVQIKGKLNLIVPDGNLPVISRTIVTYQDIISLNPKSLIIGPVYIECKAKVEPGIANIDSIEFQRQDDSYEDAIVYHFSDDIRAIVNIGKPTGLRVGSKASIYELNTGKASHDYETTDSSTIAHDLNNGGIIGNYAFFELLYHPLETLIDSKSQRIYVVFDEDNEYTSFSSSSKFEGDKVGDSMVVTLHPRSERILKIATTYVNDIPDKNNAGQSLVSATSSLLYHDEKDSDSRDDFTILDKQHGDCNDYTALYISLARSLSIPARGVKLYWLEHPNATTETGHGFAEILVNGEWIHAEPKGWYNQPDKYAKEPCQDFYARVEFEPGRTEEDKLTTLKYAVVMVEPSPYAGTPIVMRPITEKEAEVKLWFKNFAKSTKAWWKPFGSEDYIAEEFRVRVLDSGILDVDVETLSQDDTLGINEKDYATVQIRIPPELDDNIFLSGPIIPVDIKLEVRYKTVDGEEVKKNYTLYIFLRE